MGDAIVIDTTLTRYHVVRAAATSLNWIVVYSGKENLPVEYHSSPLITTREVPRLENVTWTDKSVTPDRVKGLECFQRINHFPGMDCIARKAVLFSRLMKIIKRCQQSGSECEEISETLAQFFPESFVYPTDLSHLSKAAESKANYYIVKPAKSCQGRGIFLSRNPVAELEKLEDQKEMYFRCLIQRYVDRPLLIDERKFDLRLYVLLLNACDGSRSRGSEGVRLYIHREFLTRVCAEKYASPNESNESKSKVHLSNYALNKSSPDYVFPVEGHTDQFSNKRDSAFFSDYINRYCVAAGISKDWDTTWRRLCECVVCTVLSGVGVLRRELVGTGGTRGYKADSNVCFELLGFDILLTQQALEPVLLEVNHSPSMFCDSLTDFRIKEKVVRDTLSLLQINIPPIRNKKEYVLHMENSKSIRRTMEDSAVHDGSVSFDQLLPSYIHRKKSGELDQDWTLSEALLYNKLAEWGEKV